MGVIPRLCRWPNPPEPRTLLSPRAGAVPNLSLLLSPGLLNAENLETKQFVLKNPETNLLSSWQEKKNVKSNHINIIYLLLGVLCFSCSVKFLALSPVLPLCSSENLVVPATGPR